MIIDCISNIGQYKEIPALKKAIEYVLATDLTTLPEGRTDIDGDNLYVMIQHPTLRDSSEGLLEAHDRYADLQIVLKGSETFGYALREDLGEPDETKQPDNDVCFFRKPFDSVILSAGMFGIFFPQDAHAPGIKTNTCDADVKAVIKIRL